MFPVKKGQLLVELNNDMQRAARDRAEATLAKAKAELERLKNWKLPSERGIAKAELEQAEASLRLAEFEWQRVEGMTIAEVASDKEVAATKSTLDLARARRDAARNSWDLIEAGPRSEDIAKAKAIVLEAEAQFAMVASAYEKTLIRSPIDGMVIYRFREPGEVVFPEVPSPILTVGDCSELRIRVDVDEIDVGQVRIGQEVFATAPACGDKRFAGRVVHIEPTLGRKNFRTDQPTEKVDTRILEVVVALEEAEDLPLELQMTVWFLDSPLDDGGR